MEPGPAIPRGSAEARALAGSTQQWVNECLPTFPAASPAAVGISSASLRDAVVLAIPCRYFVAKALLLGWANTPRHPQPRWGRGAPGLVQTAAGGTRCSHPSGNSRRAQSQVLTKAQSYRERRHQDFPNVFTAADSSRAVPQLCKGRVTRLELLWGKEQL